MQISRPARDANIYIRGVGPTRGATNATQLSVGVYLDQVFLLKPQGQLLDLAAIESVQVLRGPQGTLFGKNTTGELIPFDEEEIYSTEVGAKLDAWDNRLRVNAALFTMDYSNMQLFVARPEQDPNAVGSFQGVVNAGDSQIKGAELEVTALPTENWLINFSASYADGVFKEFQDFTFEDGEVVGLDRSDEDLPSLPELTFNLGVQYDWTTSFGNWTVRADAYYRDELYWGFDALSWSIPLARESATTDSFTVFNARLNRYRPY